MWLVVGGTGQLGQEIIATLTRRNIESLGTSSKNYDLKNPQLIEALITSLQPKVIINAAAYTNVDLAETNSNEAWAINADGAQNLAKFAKAVDAIYVQISTDYVFSSTSDSPIGETDRHNPINIYGKSKAAGEQAVLDMYPEKSYIFRTAWLYSAKKTNFVKTIACKALVGEDVTVVEDQHGQPTFAGDVAEQIIENIIKKIPVGCYHTTNSGSATWFEFAQEIYKLVGADPALVKPIGSELYHQVAKRPTYSVLSHQRWIEEGIVPLRDWRVALSDALPAIIFAIEREGWVNGFSPAKY